MSIFSGRLIDDPYCYHWHFHCRGAGWPLLSELWGKFLLVWTPESLDDYLNLYPNLEGALCFVSGVDANVGNDPNKAAATDAATVFIQTFDSLSWSKPVSADEITAYEAKVRFTTIIIHVAPWGRHGGEGRGASL